MKWLLLASAFGNIWIIWNYIILKCESDFYLEMCNKAYDKIRNLEKQLKIIGRNT